MKPFPDGETRKKYYEKEGKENYQRRLYSNPSDWIHQRLKDISLNCLKKSLKDFEKASALEVGCAEGFYLREIALLIKTGIGLDIAGNKIKRAKKLSSKFKNLQFIEADFLDYKGKSKSFNLIFSIETLEHIPHVRECLKKIHKLLKKGGVFICSVPTTKERLFYKEPKDWKEASGHLYHWSKNDFLSLLQFGKFEVVETRGIDNIISQIASRFLNYFLNKTRKGKIKKAFSFKNRQRRFDLTWGAKIFYQLDNLWTPFPFIKNFSDYNIFLCQKR